MCRKINHLETLLMITKSIIDYVQTAAIDSLGETYGDRPELLSLYEKGYPK